LSKFDKEYQEEFQKRTELARDGKKLAAKLEGMKEHDDAPAEEVKIVDLMAELEKLGEENRSRAEVAKLANELKLHQSDLVEEGEIILKEIAALEDKIKAKRLELDKTKEQIEASAKGEKSSREKLSKMTDRTPDIAAVKQKIAKADELNSKLRDNQAYEKLEKEHKEAQADWQKITDRLNLIKEQRTEAVANAKWRIEGMELTEDGLLLNGIPLDQCSTKERIMASVAVGMELNPKLRLLVCQHGSALDNATLDSLDAIVKEKQFQLLLEIVTRSKEDEERCAVVISDGEVVGAEKAADVDDDEPTA
jgi:hypothetical protein